MTPSTILVVDDEPDIREVIKDVLEDEHYLVLTAENAVRANELRRQQAVDLVLLDIWMPDTDGVSLLKRWQEESFEPPVIMISGHGTVETAVEAIQLGAYDFLEKPLSTAKLLVTIERALESRRQRQEITRLRSRLEPVSTLTGKSDAMEKLRQEIRRIGATDSWVFITGEPGSGKGVVARTLHEASARRGGPFVEASLAAIPAENIARHLFGSEEGGNVQPGCFEQAQGGTLLLDEITDLDLDTQAKLLSALQEGRFLRVGGTMPVDLDVRIFSSSNQDVARTVAEKRLREDLYYRLNVIPIRVAPLRKHLDDIPQLAEFYVDHFVGHEHLPYRDFDTGALNALRNHTWPGNVRELKNLVQRLLITGGEQPISAGEAKAALGVTPPPPTERTAAPADLNLDQDLRAAREALEKLYFEHHLKRLSGNMTDLAEVSGLERTHLYRKLKGLGIKPKDWK
ncbi:MAG: sigma-54 dependent transcriptional regulator [Pseudomonadota bacterium]|nr:sigma-54 dependent transcriptional regulator [Pseudomonadota bacterium]